MGLSGKELWRQRQRENPALHEQFKPKQKQKTKKPKQHATEIKR